VAFNRSEPRTDRPLVSPLPFTYHLPTEVEKKAAFGDAPDAGLLLAKRREEAHEYVSQLGEATLRNAARLIDHDPDDLPVTASGARDWLRERFRRDGRAAPAR
jgi:hypothetical protein